MPFSPATLEEKPYNACITCLHLGRHCDGPNFLAMSTDRWVEWANLRKKYLQWTNAQVAEMSGLTKSIVDRTLGGGVKDIRASTMQAITKALVNGSWGQYPCAMAAENKEAAGSDQALQRECEHLKKTITHKDRHIAELKEQIARHDTLMRERYDFLKRKDRAIVILSILAALLFLIILVATFFDRLNGGIGWIRY